MRSRNMPTADKASEYSANLKGSYAGGYDFAMTGNKSLVHKQRLLGKTKFDKGYAQGWKEYTEGKLHILLTGGTNQNY